ncbi:long-chain-fatty-acid--CoA ligase [Actinoallomurus bryophytorum]|uniref:Fatty-acyl-CoA synthase n=1 Tax=Actinoallomurus bryophytorum TaxID=1490222 RepID=A0A543C0A4_9ACTN|nr:long-chain fatty acid--CoA ligase [Actinoallomurus bryophytorum]TQL90512.1 fatty-acyl-CoA synthase [Actinoallomurus bryophytorum]
MLGLMQDRPLSLPHVFRRVERYFRHKTVVSGRVGGETTMTWAEVCTRVRRLTTVLDELGVPADARVGTFAWNSHRHVELYLAVPCTGRVLHTINHRLFGEQITYIVNDAADDVLFIDRSILPAVWPLVDSFTTVRAVLVMDDGSDAEIPDDARILDYEGRLGRAEDTEREFTVTDENTAAALCYTSGTTGNPKGVLYSHRSVVLHAALLLMVDTFGINERDVIMPIVPMFHVNAWGLPYSAMLCGADLVLPGPAMTPRELAGMLARHKVTFGAAVATVWRGLLPLLDQHDLSAVRQIVSGGGAVDEALTRAYQDAIGVPLTNAWGMTETSPVVTTSRIGTAHDRYTREERRALLATPGPAIPLTEVRVVGDDGREAPWDGRTPGELQVSGPTIAARYFSTQAVADAVTDDGWLHTGDVATVDDHGYIRIVDRTKDLVKSGGEWISSVELENAIMDHPDVAEAAVIGVADAKWGERPVAYVVARPGATLTAETVRDHARARVASWWLPDQVFFLDEIPKTATGKFSKQRLRSLYLTDTQRSAQ